MRAIASISLVFLWAFSGCALRSQTVRLHPAVEVAARSERGAGRRVAIQAIDARQDKLIGYRGGVMKTGEITTPDDVAAVIGATVGQELAKQGFRLVLSGEADITVRIELQEFHYDVVQLPHSQGVAARAAMKISAHAGDRTFEQTYSKELLKPVHAAPTAGFNANLLNRALAALLGDLFRDPSFLSFLS